MALLLKQEVYRKHASANTVYHCLYGFYVLGLPRKSLATIYGKTLATICNWIRQYEAHGFFSRKERESVYKKFPLKMRKWIVQLYAEEPVLFLDEAKAKFEKQFNVSISVASICRILHSENISWKCIERRAIQIRERDVLEFCAELSSIRWDLYNLVFIDEVSFDSRGMLRNRGYAAVGKRVLYRGEFKRKPRVSVLCFLSECGLLESYYTDGTFNRKKFFDCCRDFAINSKKVFQHPGFHSVWIWDGARIHCDPNITRYLRSLRIHIIYLPAYCPFFNPIEILFGFVKQKMKRNYVENSNENLVLFVGKILDSFKSFSATNIFRKCGYYAGGVFDPNNGLRQQREVFGSNTNVHGSFEQ